MQSSEARGGNVAARMKRDRCCSPVRMAVLPMRPTLSYLFETKAQQKTGHFSVASEPAASPRLRDLDGLKPYKLRFQFRIAAAPRPPAAGVGGSMFHASTNWPRTASADQARTSIRTDVGPPLISRW